MIKIIIFILLLIFSTINPEIVNSENLTVNITEEFAFSESANSFEETTLKTIKELVTKSNETNLMLGIFGIVAAVGSFIGGWLLSNKNLNKVIQSMVDITNAGYRITNVDSGKVAIRDDGKIGANLVKVVGGKRIVAEKKKTHTVDSILKKQEDAENS